MAFDHGQRRIAPLNICLILVNLSVWWNSTSPLLLITLALVALIATGDPYSGMFFATLFLVFALGVGLALSP